MFKKSRIALFLIVSVITVLLAVNIYFATDKPSTWAIEEIEKAKEYDLVTPKLLSNYTQNITREEFCELIVKLYETLSNTRAIPAHPNPFNDTNNSEILKAYKLGIVDGVGNGKFAPNQKINRETMYVMLYRAVKTAIPNLSTSTSNELIFNDKNEISSWALESIKYMNALGIINGVGNNNLNPKGLVTREQALVLTKRIYENHIVYLNNHPVINNNSEESQYQKITTVDHIYNFSSGLARFEDKGKYGYIDKKGFIVIEPKFDFAFDFRDDYARVIVDGKFGFIDKKGEYLIEPKFDINKYYVHDLIEGFAKINNKELELSYINSKGEIILDFEYTNAPFSSSIGNNRLIVAKKNNNGQIKYGVVDDKGKIIIPIKYNKIRMLRDVETKEYFNEYLVVSDGDKGLVMDRDGNILLDNVKYHYFNFHNGLALVKKNNKFGYINTKFEYVIEPIFDEIKYSFRATKKDLAIVKLNGKYSIINKKGKFVAEPKYAEIENFIGNFVPVCIEVKENGTTQYKWGAINEKGKLIVEPIYDNIKEWLTFDSGYDNLIKITLNGKIGLMDTNGNVLVKPMFDMVDIFYNGVAAVQVTKGNSQGWGYVRTDGKIIAEPKYSATTPFIHGIGTLSYYDDTGNPITLYINSEGQMSKNKDELPIVTIPKPSHTKETTSEQKENLNSPSQDKPYVSINDNQVVLLDANNQIVLLDAKGNKIKDIELNAYNVIVTEEFIKYASRIGEYKLINIIIDKQGNEIGRYRNNFEHYYTWNGLINFLHPTQTSDPRSWSIGLGSLMNPNEPDSYGEYMNRKDLSEIDKKIYKDQDRINALHERGVWSTGWHFAGTQLVFSSITGRMNGPICTMDHGRDMKDGSPYVDILNWTPIDSYHETGMFVVMNSTMELFKFFAKSERDAEMIWQYIDDFIKIEKRKKLLVKEMTFGDTKVVFSKVTTVEGDNRFGIRVKFVN